MDQGEAVITGNVDSEKQLYLARRRCVITGSLYHTMKNILLTIAIVLIAGRGSAQQWVDHRYSYDSLMNVPYGTAVDFNGKTVPLTLDLYFPQCDDPQHISRRPLLLLIHGGAFLAGGKNDANIKSLCTSFARRGYVTATIEYRLGFIADDVAWACNYPAYECIFAADTSEWYRAYYRAVQDGKGALRFLMNRNAAFRIDTANVFLAGESAGAFIALGVGLMDTLTERPPLTGTLPDVMVPATSTNSCSYNQGQNYSGSTVARPDLGGFEGTIEPTTVRYSVKGIGNFYGAMFNDLLQWNTSANRPAIYSFHQPCDIIVPISADRIYWGFSWCMTNGYGCSAIANTPLVYGSQSMSQWNIINNYGYTIQNEFTVTPFPFNYLLGAGSCIDQVNNPCHAFDSFSLRDRQLAQFFSGQITTFPLCDTIGVISVSELDTELDIRIFPNPATSYVSISTMNASSGRIYIVDAEGKLCWSSDVHHFSSQNVDISEWADGVYTLVFISEVGVLTTIRWMKHE